PNRTVKQLCADDSAATSVKVGYRQASYIKKPLLVIQSGLFCVYTLPVCAGALSNHRLQGSIR
ncbi:hypothetical protein, partial [Duganella vulcania]|uniref:hypothetical protein n=1 Tax=Duganella vulcania TaxID=2692166 RepID=UPI001C2DDF44